MSLDQEKFEQAAVVLRNGGVVIHPTETVYGIAAIWNDEKALQKTAKLKQRDLRKPFSILVNRVDQILEIAGGGNSRLKKLLEETFPAPLTILLPRKNELPLPFWNQFPAIGFRMSDFELCNRLVEMAAKPLITTSANLAHQHPPKTASQIDSALIKQADLFLEGGDCPLKIPSTVLRFNPETQEVGVLREGAFPAKTFEERIREIYQ